MKPIIVYRRDFSSYFSSDFAQREKEHLSQALVNFEVTYCQEEDEVKKTAGAVILLTNSQSNLNQYSSETFARTQLLIHANSGYDNISAEFVENAQFPIVIGNEIRAQAVATYVLSCLFDHYCKPPFISEWDKNRSWKRKLIGDLRILVLGYGNIGKILVKTLQGLGCQADIYDPYQEATKQNLCEPEKADVIIPLMGLNQSSHNIIDRSFLNKMKSDALIINAARGDLIEQDALKNFLQQNPDAFAYLDVFRDEPFSPLEFKNIKNAKLSSHIAGVYENLDQKLIEYEARVLKSFLTKKEAFSERYKDVLLKNRLINKELI